MVRDEGTDESKSLYIQSFSGISNVVTSPTHNLLNGDFIVIENCLGSVGSFVNGRIFSVFDVTTNTFSLSPDPEIGSSTYFGEGTIKRIYVPYIQTKQFPTFWEMARKTRLGPQQYLFTTTDDSQITLLIFLSQNIFSAYNEGNIVPSTSSQNNSLIYSSVLFTCTESSNLGLTPYQSNLQTPTAFQQDQLWHRMNTSLIGDTVQIGFTLSEDQIRSLIPSGNEFAITGATQANPCVLTCTGGFQPGQLILISDVQGMIELNENIYQVITSDATTVTINIDSSAFTPYTEGGFATQVANVNNFAEIELHGFILDVNPSQLLV